MERLIDLTLPNGGTGAAQKPISNLAQMHLRELKAELAEVLEREDVKVDSYTRAHLMDADTLIDRALDSLPERGDLFIATRRTPGAEDRAARLRVLLRHHDPRAEGIGGELDPVHHILEYVLAETIVEALGGRLTIDPTQGPETLIVIDLPTA